MKLLKVHHWNCQADEPQGELFLQQTLPYCWELLQGVIYLSDDHISLRVLLVAAMGIFRTCSKAGKCLVCWESSAPALGTPIHWVCWGSGFALPQSWHPLLASELVNATECVFGDRFQVPWNCLSFTDQLGIVVLTNQAGLLERLNYFPL